MAKGRLSSSYVQVHCAASSAITTERAIVSRCSIEVRNMDKAIEEKCRPRKRGSRSRNEGRRCPRGRWIDRRGRKGGCCSRQAVQPQDGGVAKDRLNRECLREDTGRRQETAPGLKVNAELGARGRRCGWVSWLVVCCVPVSCVRRRLSLVCPSAARFASVLHRDATQHAAAAAAGPSGASARSHLLGQSPDRSVLACRRPSGHVRLRPNQQFRVPATSAERHAVTTNAQAAHPILMSAEHAHPLALHRIPNITVVVVITSK